MLRIFQFGPIGRYCRQLAPLCLLASTALAAQLTALSSGCQVTLRVIYENQTAARQGLELMVQGNSGFSAMAYTDADGMVRLRVPAGDYVVKLRDRKAEQASDFGFSIAAGETLHTEEFRIRAVNTAGSTQSTIAVSELQLSPGAKRELEKGLESLKRQDLSAASKRFNKVLQSNPNCGPALNGLGIIAMQSGKTSDAKSYFAQAVEVDPQFPPAYLNLGRVLLLAKDYAGGEALLQRATSLDPTSSETLSLLAYFQLLGGKFDSAIATAHRVHLIQHERFAMVHFVAANAYERKQQQKEAGLEYQQYLQEDPHGPSAERARSKLTVIEATAR